jgi:hypothetical protein
MVIGHHVIPPAIIGADARRFYRTSHAQELHVRKQRWPDRQFFGD